MSERTSFYRKIAYGVAILVILFMLRPLSSPATTSSAGGKLAQLRTDHRLGQANLGEIDPASETMKLATLGFRGIAVNWLWEYANHYKKTEDWTNLTATLEQLARLQPNFITFWKFQAWNLSYNVSVEFDDYHDRYYYVRRGIQFLEEGERYNVNNPNLLWDLGWFVGQKIGRADEHVQYRRLFQADDDFHPADRPPDLRDNWLVGKEWYEKGIRAVDDLGHDLGRKSARIFYSSPAMSQINYADAIEKEGYFEKARRAWIAASEEWRDFGNVVIEHSTGVKLRLGDQPRLEQLVAELRSQLDGLMPEARRELEAERLAALSDEERQVVDRPLEDLTPRQYEIWSAVQEKRVVTDRDVAERIAEKQPEDARRALLLTAELEREGRRLQYTINYKRDSNYDYWATRSAFEQTPNALAAREFMFRARNAFRNEADLLTAKDLYQQGFEKWRLVIDEFPTILDDQAVTGDDLVDYTRQYRQVLDQLDETLGNEYPLWDVLENFDNEREFTEEIREYRQRAGASSQDAEDDLATADEDAELEVEASDAEAEAAEAETPEGRSTEAQPAEVESAEARPGEAAETALSPETSDSPAENEQPADNDETN